MSEDPDNNKTLEAKMLDFAESSLTEVERLRKEASDKDAEIKRLNSELEKAQAKQTPDSSKQASSEEEQRELFDEEYLDGLCEALAASNMVDKNSDQIKQAFQSDPNSVLATFKDILVAENSDGELTSIKSASETKPDLWRQAAAE